MQTQQDPVLQSIADKYPLAGLFHGYVGLRIEGLVTPPKIRCYEHGMVSAVFGMKDGDGCVVKGKKLVVELSVIEPELLPKGRPHLSSQIVQLLLPLVPNKMVCAPPADVDGAVAAFQYGDLWVLAVVAIDLDGQARRKLKDQLFHEQERELRRLASERAKEEAERAKEEALAAKKAEAESRGFASVEAMHAADERAEFLRKQAAEEERQRARRAEEKEEAVKKAAEAQRRKAEKEAQAEAERLAKFGSKKGSPPPSSSSSRSASASPPPPSGGQAGRR